MSIESIDATQIFTGRRVFFIGATGFVGKVALSMLLCRFPGIGKVFTLVRPGSGMNARERFFKKIAASRPFDPLRERFGDALPGFLEDKVVPLGGDVSQPRIGLSDADLALLTAEPLHAIINCAGLVSFNPSLESALRINVNGVRHTIDLARRTGAALIHVSTCFVAGNRDGEVWEDEPLIGYFPRKDELRDDDFSAEAEIADCERLIAQTRARADDRARVSLFRDRGAQRLIKEGRDPDDERHLRAAVQRERKMWMAEALTELGMERARHWGWPNTYTYTKSLGDQLCALSAQTPTETGAPLRVAIVRPAIVESAMRYPFPGWNEGFNTTAPLIFMALKGQMQIPAGKDAVLDVIPVDMVASGLIAATAAAIAGANKLVYQLGSSDLNPFRMGRSAELTGLYRRRYYRARRDESVLNRVRARMESVPVTKERYQLASLPLFRDMGSKLSRLIEENIPTWGAPRVAAFLEHAKEQIDGIVQVAEQGVSIFDLFMPFIYDNAIAFRCDHTRDLFARLAPHDRAALSWEPEAINWREYFMDVHLPGLEKWIFPSLDEEFQARPKAVYTYRDLLELFAAATKHYRGRTAMRLLAPPGPDGEPQGEGLRYTYRDLQERASRMAAALIQKGVGPGSKVVIMSENRPEWGMAYFGVLKAGATAVPVDSSATADELANIRRASRAQAVLLSRKVAERLQLEPGTDGVSLLEDLGVMDRGGSTALVHVPTLPTAGRADEMASLLFTSGTTGRPKGVMLSHRNFTSLLAKLGAIFDLDRHDGLLSVLPLHHTFEFTAGLLMPLMRGAQISYLQEITPESLSAAFRSQLVTGMVGVPALWQVLYRRVVKQLTERPFLDSPWVVRLFEEALHLFYRLRDSSLRSLGADVNVSRLLLFPVHRRFGGRIRLLISGGSALPAEIMKVMRGLGFHLYEGYGLTEAAPVLTVTRPGQPLALGSVGAPLPGIDLKLHEPDESGVGEVIASGPNIMAGYYEDPEATAEVLKDGFLHTGDLGRFDEEGRLYIVGRRKDVIIGMNGENVYPDELEDCYRESPYLKELSVVGLPAQDQGGDGKRDEVVACLAVPSYEGHGLSREEVRERLREHFQKVSARLPPAKRIKVLHLSDIELPRTSTRKVKRKLVVEELLRLGRVQKQAAAARQADGEGGGVGFLAAVLAEVTGKRREGITEATALQELGLDSLTYAELGVALEAAGVAVPGGADLSGVGTVGDLLRLVDQWGQIKEKARAKARPKGSDRSKDRSRGKDGDDADTVRVPEILRRAGDEGLNLGQRMLYERYLDTRITGRAYLPRASRFIVAANHASHLDMGLVKYALGEWGDRLVALAARDYFFEDPLRRVYFENFTSLIPMDRHGSIRESLRLSEEVIRQGHILLIFPEGTRSESGVMKDFKPSIGYLALHNQIDVLPMYLRGTHDAMPKGRFLPQRRTVWAHIGPVVSYRAMRAALAGVPRTEHNRTVARLIEQAVRRLAPGDADTGGAGEVEK